MRRPFASLPVSLLLSLAMVVPTIAADPQAGAKASAEPGATPSAELTPSPEPTPTAEPTASEDPTASEEPAPTTEPTPSAAADPTPGPLPTEATEPTLETPPAPEATPQTKSQAAPAAGEPATDTKGRPIAAGRYIVILSPTADTAAVITRHGKQDGIKADRRFDKAVRAFSAKLDAKQRRALQSDPSVVAVVPDEVIGITAQTTPTGVSRVGAGQSATASINNVDERVDADVAIVDTGVAMHPDLNVVGGVNCSTSDRTKWQDENGHGTHVAGTVAALDNTIGVVGVAPGARIWAVRILNADGYGLLSWYVCGLDWILAQRDPLDATRPLIEAVNMSVAKSGKDATDCGVAIKDVLHQAICRLYKGGITVVAAAANERTSAAGFVPAAYNEVITVSALADTDGKAGGLGGNRCFSWGTYDVDDTFADFSNFGSDVDIIAPGKCIWSTTRGPSYGYSSGTSMAAPAVAGAVALYKASRPLATPSEVRESLRYLGNFGWATSTDPDSYHEPLLDVSRVAALGTFSVSAAATARIPSTGGAVTLPISVHRSSTFFERVRLSFAGVPSGWSATLAATSLLGWTANGTTATITAPSTAKPGIYQMQVVGTNWGRIRSSTITIEVAGDRPLASAPTAKAATGKSTGLLSSGAQTIPVRVSWRAATDASDAIVGYQVQHSADGGAWRTVATAATTRSVIFSLSNRASHRFQVRAKDSDGDWSEWAANATAYRISSVGDRSASLAYGGTWRKSASASAIGRTLTSSGTRGARVSYRYTGRGVAIVGPMSPTRGKARIYVDGVYRTTIDFRSSSVRHRRIVYAISYTVSGTHTIQMRVLGTSGRPLVSLDAFVVLR